MTESQLYELLGRKQAKLEEVMVEYEKFLAVVLLIKEGKVEMDRLTIQNDGKWNLGPAIAKSESNSEDEEAA